MRYEIEMQIGTKKIFFIIDLHEFSFLFHFCIFRMIRSSVNFIFVTSQNKFDLLTFLYILFSSHTREALYSIKKREEKNFLFFFLCLFYSKKLDFGVQLS